MLSHDEFRQQKGDFEMKKEQNRHSLHLIRQNVPQFILLVIFSVLLGVSVIAVSVLMKMFLDIATNASTMPLTTCLIIAVGVLLVPRHLTGRHVRFAGQAFLPHGAFSAQRHGGAPLPHRPKDIRQRRSG